MVFTSHMQTALDEARKAGARGEVPVGAVVADPQGRIVAQAGNRTRELNDPTAHAEILALRKNSSAYDAPGASVAAMVDAISHHRNRLLPCVAPDLARLIRGFDGLEAMGIMGDRVYMTIEAKEDTVMAGYLVCGHYGMVGEKAVIDMTRMSALRAIPTPYPAAGPLTAAITGLEQSDRAQKNSRVSRLWRT